MVRCLPGDFGAVRLGRPDIIAIAGYDGVWRSGKPLRREDRGVVGRCASSRHGPCCAPHLVIGKVEAPRTPRNKKREQGKQGKKEQKGRLFLFSFTEGSLPGCKL